MIKDISALMPVRNGENFLHSSISTIEKNQAHLNEILVIDDGSTDNTSFILRNWSEQNSKVRILRTRGLGLVKSLNLGLQELSSEFIARFDVDDTYSEDRIAQQANYLNPDTAAVFSDYSFWSEKNGYLGYIPAAIFPHATSLSLFNAQRTAHPSVIYSREAVLGAGGYREGDFPAEDYSLWLRLAKEKFLISVPKVLLNYRLSSGSISLSQRESMLRKKLELRHSIGISKIDYRISIENLSDTLKRYEDFEKAKVRKFLHMIDLLHISSQLDSAISDRKMILKYLYQESRKVDGYFDAIQFGSQTFRRKFVRQALKRV